MIPEIFESKFRRGDKVKLRCAVLTARYTSGALALIHKLSEGEVTDTYIDPDFQSLGEAIPADNINPEDLFCCEVQFGSSPSIRIASILLKRVKIKTKKEIDSKNKTKNKDTVSLAPDAMHKDIGGSGYLDPKKAMPQPSGVNMFNGKVLSSEPSKIKEKKPSKKTKKALKQAEKLSH